ncbi:MAG TPA: hypothetical protein ENJ82_00245 [Bacteroidetes bacterium]|nr:hypothetical protein [Bacteroidota bacterium]
MNSPLKAYTLWILPLMVLGLLMPSCKPSDTVRSAPKWLRLGGRQVDFKGEKDVIAVTGERGKFSALRIKVNRSSIFLNTVIVTFGNGETLRVKLGRRILAGNETQSVDLPGAGRTIRKVELNYRTLPGAKFKAEVVLWGRR